MSMSMPIPRRVTFLVVVLLSMMCSPLVAATADPISPGTTITLQNWQQYKQYMTDGMQALFAGTYHWKFPPDFQLEVGPSRNYPLGSKEYIENTEKYGSQVRIVTLPTGGHNIANYTAGLPFASPAEPLKGWKILVNDWFAYQPYEMCTSPGFSQVFEDKYGNVSSLGGMFVERRMAHISDPGQPIDEPRAVGQDFVQYAELFFPEQARYTAIMTIYHYNLATYEDSYVFVPALRRSLRLATTARCSPVFGSDFTYDDTRHGAFNGNITRFDAEFLRNQKILMAPAIDVSLVENDKSYYPSLMFGKPALGKWEVRDTYVIDVRRIASERAGYCYGKRILYVDTQVMQAMWADLYDANMKLWKIDYDPQAITDVAGVGKIWTNNGWGTMWDIQNEHLTLVKLPMVGNQACMTVNGIDYTNLKRYFSVSGLSQIMR